MNKFHLILFIILIAAFGGIFYVTQKSSIGKSFFGNEVPQLPAQGSMLQLISTPIPQQTQSGQQLSQVGGQTQQQAPQQSAQGGVQNTQQSQPLPASVSATIHTSKGDISVVLFGDVAPNTVINFINKANSGFYNGLIFHRVEDWVIQGGDPLGNGTGGGEMQTEINQKPFLVGSIGMARGNNIQISNASQFFITKTDASWLNGQYDNFGMVTSGMDVVNNIQIGDKILGITINTQ